MGQAKQRGSKEQRIAQAFERQAAEQVEYLKKKELERIANIEREANLTPNQRLSRERARKGLVALAVMAGMSASLSNMDLHSSRNPLLRVGGKYNWKGQPERLIYLGHNHSGNGYWHQFAKVESPEKIWCEVVTADLHMIEPTVD